MKKLLAFLFLLTLSLSSFAEVKPEWSIVSNMCGDNTSPTMVANAPYEVCMASVTGHQDLQVVIFKYDFQDAEYFLITGRTMRMGANTVEMEELSVSTGGRYTFIGDLVDHGEVRVMTEIMGFAGMILKGHGFNGTMQPVFTTLGF